MPLGPDASASEFIRHFVASDNPQFEGKSKAERVRMALGAHYAQKSVADFEAEVQKMAADVGDIKDVQVETRIAKISDELGVAFGWAVICKINGQPYYDLNVSKGERIPEHIPEDAMLKAACDFMAGARPGNVQHAGPDDGTYLFAFPMTTDIAKAMGIETKVTGLMVAYKPTPETFAKFKSGELKGFSIEGRRIKFNDEEYK